MSRLSVVKLFLVCMLILAMPGLLACSADEEGESEETAQETVTESEDEAENVDSDNPLVGSWVSADAYYFAAFTLFDDGTGTGFETEDSEVDIAWTLEDDYLEFEYGSGSVLGGGFDWTTEGEEFVWDAGGIYTRAE